MIRIATHDAKFHTDDVFAVATLFIALGKGNCEVIRTRDEKVIDSCDYVLDVGMKHDADKNRFDHHQLEGAGKRENGIPYASFGLVWKKFGPDICGSKEIAEDIDRTIVQSVDAADNGTDTLKPLFEGVYPYDVNNVVNLYRPTWREDPEWDKKFIECVDWAVSILNRLVKVSKDAVLAREVVIKAYEAATDKRLIILDEQYDLGRELVMGVLSNFSEPIYALLYRADAGNWQLVCMRKEHGSYESRKPLPLEWRGKTGAELVASTGVSGAIFCHRSGFMCVIEGKEGALELARKALNA